MFLEVPLLETKYKYVYVFLIISLLNPRTPKTFNWKHHHQDSVALCVKCIDLFSIIFMQ